MPIYAPQQIQISIGFNQEEYYYKSDLICISNYNGIDLFMLIF